MRSVGACSRGSSTTSPRPILSLATPSSARLSAARSPAWARSAGRLWTRMARMRAASPPGLTITRSPVAAAPDSAVPVTIVPAPWSVNDRSTARRNSPFGLRPRKAAAASKSAAFSSATPAPVAVETRRIGASARPVSASAIRASRSASANRFSSMRSILVRATRPRSIPSRSRIARCSFVWGITPSSAATTMRAKSIPPTPASMVCTKRSWPGASTKPSVAPDGVGM